MRILCTTSIAEGPDYLFDSIFHGLRTLLGDSVVDAPRLWYMYKNTFAIQNESQSLFFNKGFTYYGDMEDLPVDRTDMVNKIRSHYYDLIVIGRPDKNILYQEEIFKNYKPHEIVILDGQDGSVIHKYLLGKAIYFKREFYYGPAGVYPISFSFPREKLQNRMEKTKFFSIVDPRNRSTYIHTTEESYYADYGTSYFGVTTKKSGWDCPRHYEIIACNSIPLFLDIKSCPENICTTLPKHLLIDALDTYEHRGEEWFYTKEGADYYYNIREHIYNLFVIHCLTGSAAKRVIDKHIIHKS